MFTSNMHDFFPLNLFWTSFLEGQDLGFEYRESHNLELHVDCLVRVELELSMHSSFLDQFRGVSYQSRCTLILFPEEELN